VSVEPNPSGDDEPLEAFYGDDADEVARLNRISAEVDAEIREREASGDGGGAGGARWRAPATGALMAGIAMGLRDVFDPEPRDRIAIEQPAPEQPLEPQKYEVHLDPDAPESSFAIYRPWLEGADDPGPEDATDASMPTKGDGRAPRECGGMGALGG
jgi:hypothetical protein